MKISVTITLFLYILCLSDPVLSAVIITSPLKPGQYIYYGDARDAYDLYRKAFGMRSGRTRRQNGTLTVGNTTSVCGLPTVGLNDTAANMTVTVSLPPGLNPVLGQGQGTNTSNGSQNCGGSGSFVENSTTFGESDVTFFGGAGFPADGAIAGRRKRSAQFQNGGHSRTQTLKKPAGVALHVAGSILL